MSHHPIAPETVAAAGRLAMLGWRIELRAPSPDQSVPSGGKLLAVAVRTRGGWTVQRRGGQPVTVATRTEALLMLGRMADELVTDQADQATAPEAAHPVRQYRLAFDGAGNITGGTVHDAVTGREVT